MSGWWKPNGSCKSTAMAQELWGCPRRSATPTVETYGTQPLTWHLNVLASPAFYPCPVSSLSVYTGHSSLSLDKRTTKTVGCCFLHDVYSEECRILQTKAMIGEVVQELLQQSKRNSSMELALLAHSKDKWGLWPRSNTGARGQDITQRKHEE